MAKSERISAQFDRVLNALELADHEIQKIPGDVVHSNAEFGSAVIYDLHNRIQDLLSDIEELHFETISPLQAEEEEREEEIRVLERRLAELKSA